MQHADLPPLVSSISLLKCYMRWWWWCPFLLLISTQPALNSIHFFVSPPPPTIVCVNLCLAFVLCHACLFSDAATTLNCSSRRRSSSSSTGHCECGGTALFSHSFLLSCFSFGVCVHTSSFCLGQTRCNSNPPSLSLYCSARSSSWP